MKTIRFIFNVIVLVLMLTGIYLIGMYLGCDDDMAHGKLPFMPSRHLLASGLVILFWAMLPFATRFTATEFITTAIVAQLIVIAWVTFRVYCHGDITSSGWLFRGWLTWVWIYARLLTFPFAVTIISSLALTKAIKRGQPSASPYVSPEAGEPSGDP